VLLSLAFLAPLAARCEPRITASQKGFYTKQNSYAGIPIKAPAVVADAALFAAYDQLATELAHLPEIAQKLAARRKKCSEAGSMCCATTSTSSIV
jgi:hypothetical protein